MLEQLFIIGKSGKKRPATYVKCDYCNTEFLKQTRMISVHNFCNREHYNLWTKKDFIDLICAHCSKEFTRSRGRLQNSKSGIYFCCRECKDSAQRYMIEIQPDHYGTSNGLSGYRKIAFEAYGKHCYYCGYSNEDALEVHHINRDRTNNNKENLRVCCANCHTLIHKGALAG